MNCEASRILLDRVLDGTATAEEEQQLLAHEQACPACAGAHRELAALQQELASLKDDVPPMPASFHQGWTTLVEETAMEPKTTEPKKKTEHPIRRQWTRILAAAAAVVFVVGGTLLTRDEFSATQRPAAYKSAPAETYEYDEGGWSSTAAYGSAAPMAASSRSYVMNDSVAYDMEDAAYDMETEEAADVSKIIRTASLSIGTKAYDESQATLRQLCSDLGGYVSSANERTNSSSGLRTLSITLRIPAANLDAFLDGVGGTGRVTSRSESMEDVTDSYQDTQARLATQQAMMARLQALVTEAADLSDLLVLENQIADTQYTIDRLTASLMATDKRVNFSTVDLTLREEKAGEVIVDAKVTLGERLTNALQAGVEAFADFLADMCVFLAAALPFLAVIVMMIVAVRVVLKLRRKHKKAE